jgi:tRNA pseudouridine55 synthase
MRADVRHELKIRHAKIGHAGSLDPLATGLLIVCLGRKATKQIDQFQNQEKEYTGTLLLGATTPSYDLETEINERFSIEHITPRLLSEAAKQFEGDIWQYPPIFSAKKINGERAYHIARNGGQAEVKPALLHVSTFQITHINLPSVDFKVICSKGTYIRSLVHDLGKTLQCGAVLTALCRTRIGNYQLENACELNNWMNPVNALSAIQTAH